MKRRLYSIVIPLIFAAFVVSCNKKNPTTDLNNNMDSMYESSTNKSIDDLKNASEIPLDLAHNTNADYNINWQDNNPSYIIFENSSASITGFGAKFVDNIITIDSAGVYVISGSLDDGQVIVDVDDTSSVQLVLKDVSLHSNNSSPIYIKNAHKVTITLDMDTKNFISDGKTYVLEDKSSDKPNAVIYSKSDLIINGSGTLNIKANFKNGITSHNDIKIIGSNVSIESEDDGLIGRDMIAIKDSNVTIHAGGDGIKSNNNKDSKKGTIILENGKYNITSGQEGIQAETSILITDGDYIIKTKSKNAIQAAFSIDITGGVFHIDSGNDAIHSSKNIVISGGDFNITSVNDGVHANSSIDINGGSITITKSCEGIEGASINISGGDIHIIAYDDGINVAGGNDDLDGESNETYANSTSKNTLNITNGYIVINSMGDGIDINGSAYMTGGTLLVSGPTNDKNGALDYDDVFILKGGYLIAAGSSGMALAPSEQSTQNSILYYFSNTQEAGSLTSLVDQDGNVLLRIAPEKEYSSIVISTPDILIDSSYTLYTGGSADGKEIDGLYMDGNYKKGTKLIEFIPTKSVTLLTMDGELNSESK